MKTSVVITGVVLDVACIATKGPSIWEAAIPMHCMLSILALAEANGISDINGKPSMVKYVMDSVGAVICCFALVGGDKEYGLIPLRPGKIVILCAVSVTKVKCILKSKVLLQCQVKYITGSKKMK